MSFTLKEDTEEAARDVVSDTRLFTLAESLGGTKSLINHPARMTHKSIPTETRRQVGIPDSLIRLSVGLEDAELLIRDLDETLNRCFAHNPVLCRNLENAWA